MTVDIFTKEVFESTLPVHKLTGKPLWSYAGVIDGEHTYNMPVREGVSIMIRSSVRINGQSAGSGEDSIRIWLVGKEGKTLGSKINAYITRVNGWNNRLTAQLRELYRRGMSLKPCPDCGELMPVYKCKKDGRNKGRLFTTCWKHKHFRWVKVG